MHELFEAHDIPVKTPAQDWGYCEDQLAPFHRCTKNDIPTGPLNVPTAVQAVAELHDTPLRTLYVAPGELGLVWIDQLVPFHRSAKVTTLPARLWKYPTAIQAVGDVHDTALSWPDVAPVGLGVGCIVQLVPFHRSANVPWWPSGR
jgi:hypothetical protein